MFFDVLVRHSVRQLKCESPVYLSSVYVRLSSGVYAMAPKASLRARRVGLPPRRAARLNEPASFPPIRMPNGLRNLLRSGLVREQLRRNESIKDRTAERWGFYLLHCDAEIRNRFFRFVHGESAAEECRTIELRLQSRAWAHVEQDTSANAAKAWLPALAERCCDVYGKHRCRFERDCPCINLPNRVDRLVFACGLVLTA